MLEPACLNSKRGMNETDIFSRNINLNYGQTSNLEDKPCKCINEYKSKRNNNIGESSTLVTTRRRKNSFNRCQSAFIRSQNNFYN